MNGHEHERQHDECLQEMNDGHVEYKLVRCHTHRWTLVEEDKDETVDGDAGYHDDEKQGVVNFESYVARRRRRRAAFCAADRRGRSGIGFHRWHEVQGTGRFVHEDGAGETWSSVLGQ
ncbi:hypothetical protein MRX96_031625 [Rhipicephalus microplus]